jgi:transcriptional regulator with GAF, ATPase, and Fis domain
VLDLGNELLGGAAANGSPRAPTTAASATTVAGTNGGTLEAIERKHIVDTLERSGWVIDGPRGAAAALAMRPSTLRSRMKKLGVARPI